jgi:phosphoribosylaminoimidazole carboxylase PurE protein
MGSDSDLPVMAECVRVLESYGIAYDVRVLSAHRTPEQTAAYAREAAGHGLKILIAGAGGSAHLAGALAAHSTLPVIGVPLGGSPLSGFDALLSTVQMPPGIPVATVGVGPMGAKNAGHLAATILGLSDPELATRLTEHRRKLADEALAKAAGLPEKLRALLGAK